MIKMRIIYSNSCKIQSKKIAIFKNFATFDKYVLKVKISQACEITVKSIWESRFLTSRYVDTLIQQKLLKSSPLGEGKK